MIINTKDFKEVCSTILSTIDSSKLSTYTETLELEVKDKILFLNVTNGEYFVSVKFTLDEDYNFHASVNASLFLKLISAITTEKISLECKDKYLEVKANGIYKIPFIFEEDDTLLKLPEITIENPTTSFKISGSILNSILLYNSKEVSKESYTKPVQQMYYVDEKGCLTFTSGACVNYFQLEKPIKALFNQRLVKLFKLFKDDMIDFTLGYDTIEEDITQLKVKFETKDICLTAITGCNDDLIQTVPVDIIRGRAEFEYPYNIVFNTKELLEAVNRLMLFSDKYDVKYLKPFGYLEFKKDIINIYDRNKENVESIKYKNNEENTKEEYSLALDLANLKSILSNISEEYITMSFGNHQAIVIKRSNIYNIIPECKM